MVQMGSESDDESFDAGGEEHEDDDESEGEEDEVRPITAHPLESHMVDSPRVCRVFAP